MARVRHHLHDAATDCLLEISRWQNDVRALAAELLGDTLDGRGSRLGHKHTGAGGPREAHHVDIRMRRQGGADAGSVTIDEVEHAFRHAGLMHDLGQDDRVERRDFGGLENHGAAGSNRRGDLAGNLVQWPVPGRDEATDPDCLLAEQRRTFQLFELVVAQDGRGGREMAHASRHLGRIGQPHGRAHFIGDGFGHFRQACLNTRSDLFQQLGTVFHAGLREGREGRLGRRNGLVDIRLGPDRNDREILFSRRILDFHRTRLHGVYPCTIDIELLVFLHAVRASLWSICLI